MDEKTIARFWAKVDKRGPDECWEWTAYRCPKGYGRFSAAIDQRAHRASWILSRGQIAPGMFICHRCDNPPCCNPAHLFIGRAADNVADKIAKGRSRHAAGEGVGTAKLTAAAVVEARALRAKGWTQWDIANKYGVTQAAIWFMLDGRTWRHVEQEGESV